MGNGTLFGGMSVHDVKRAQIRALEKKIGMLTAEELNSEGESALLERLYNEFDLPAPALIKDETSTEEGDEEVRLGRQEAFLLDREPGSRMQMRHVEFYVPIAGDARALAVQPSSYSVGGVRGVIDGQNVVLKYPMRGNPDEVRKAFEQDLANIEAHLLTLAKDFEAFNLGLRAEIQTRLDSRRALLSERSGFMEGLGYPKRPSS